MHIQIIEHPLVVHKLTLLCDQNIPLPVFRQLVDELITLLAYEATRGVAVREIDVTTPVVPTKGLFLAYPRPILIPILRMGLGTLGGMPKPLPTAEIGFLGMKRDKTMLEAHTYANRLPDDFSGRQCYVMDLMLATGHTLIDAVNYLLEHGARDVTYVCLLAAPESLRDLGETIGNRVGVTIVSVTLDECLSENGYIVSGLGGASDRFYGIAN